MSWTSLAGSPWSPWRPWRWVAAPELRPRLPPATARLGQIRPARGPAPPTPRGRPRARTTATASTATTGPAATLTPRGMWTTSSTARSNDAASGPRAEARGPLPCGRPSEVPDDAGRGTAQRADHTRSGGHDGPAVHDAQRGQVRPRDEQVRWRRVEHPGQDLDDDERQCPARQHAQQDATDRHVDGLAPHERRELAGPRAQRRGDREGAAPFDQPQR